MNEEEEHEYRRWSAEPDARNEQPVSNELNDIPFAAKYDGVIGPILGLWLFGGFIIISIIIPAGEGGTWATLIVLHIFLFFSLGYYLIEKPRKEYEERQKLATEASRKRNNEKKRKRNLDEKNKDLEKAKNLVDEGGIDNLKKAIGIFKRYLGTEIKEALVETKKKLAGELEEHLKYKEAIEIWEELGMHKEAKRIRSKIKEEEKVKVDQTVVHGDYVDDRDTIVKDSVINRSNVGAGGDDKFSKLKELKEMLTEGLIDDDEFKQMKKEILGK